MTPRTLLFGYRQDPPDPRDWKFDELRPKLTLAASASDGSEHRIPLHRTPRTQTGQSCTANAWLRAIEILSDLEGASLQDLSAQGMYWCERQREGALNIDGGAFLRTGPVVLKTFGAAPASTWPDNGATLFTQPDAAFFVQAEDGKITAYYRIDADDPIDDIEMAVRANHPVVFGTEVGAEFVHWDGLDASRVFDPPDKALGGHTMVVVGVRGIGDDRQFLVLTSWGAYGLDGMGVAWISATYMRASIDVWVATKGGPS